MKKNAALIMLVFCVLWSSGCRREDQRYRDNTVISIYKDEFRKNGDSTQVELLRKLSKCLNSYKFGSCQKEKTFYRNSLVGEGERRINPTSMALFEYIEAIQVPTLAKYAMYIRIAMLCCFMFIFILTCRYFLLGHEGLFLVGVTAVVLGIVFMYLEGVVEDEASGTVVSATNHVLIRYKSLESAREVANCLKTRKIRDCHEAISVSLRESRRQLKNGTSDYQKLLLKQIRTINAM